MDNINMDNFAVPENIIAAGAKQDIAKMQFVQSGQGITTMSGFEADGMPYRFFMDSVLNLPKSQEEGYEIWEEKESVEFIKDKSTKIVYETKYLSQDRLARNMRNEVVGGSMFEAFKAWQEGKEVEGLKLEKWDAVSDSQVRTLNSEGIYSVEQLAQVPVDRIKLIFRGNPTYEEIHNRAKLYVGNKDFIANAKAQSGTIEELQKRIAELESSKKPANALKGKK